MKLYWTAILTCWTTGWVTYAATKVGQMSQPSEYSSGLPFVFFAFIAFPALVGYLLGRETMK